MGDFFELKEMESIEPCVKMSIFPVYLVAIWGNWRQWSQCDVSTTARNKQQQEKSNDKSRQVSCIDQFVYVYDMEFDVPMHVNDICFF